MCNVMQVLDHSQFCPLSVKATGGSKLCIVDPVLQNSSLMVRRLSVTLDFPLTTGVSKPEHRENKLFFV